MAIRPRTRKRVEAVRRAADGSAFEKCEECGVMIAIALFDMHECGEKRREVKRFKCISSGKLDNTSKPSFEDEPRSPFVFFLEDFRKNYVGNMVDASRICFIVWKNMSAEDQKPFIARAAEVDLAHNRKLKEEAKRIYKSSKKSCDICIQSFLSHFAKSKLAEVVEHLAVMNNLQADDEADSKAVAKFDKLCECFDHEEDYDSSDHFEHEFWEDDTLLKY